MTELASPFPSECLLRAGRTSPLNPAGLIDRRDLPHRLSQTEARSFVNSTIREGTSVRSERTIKVGQRIPEEGVDKKLEKKEPHRLSLSLSSPSDKPFQSPPLIPPPKASEGP